MVLAVAHPWASALSISDFFSTAPKGLPSAVLLLVPVEPVSVRESWVVKFLSYIHPWGAKHVPDYRAPCTPGTAFRFVKGRCESCYKSSALVSSHIRAPRHLHRLVCECLSATKGERGRGRIDSIARSQKGTSASGQGGPQVVDSRAPPWETQRHGRTDSGVN